jgi:hypothetical protein
MLRCRYARNGSGKDLCEVYMLRGFRFQKRYTQDVIAQLYNHSDNQVLVHYLWEKDTREERTASFLCVNGVSYRIIMDNGRFIKAKEFHGDESDFPYDDENVADYLQPSWRRYPIKLVECDLPANVVYDCSKYFDFEVPEDTKLFVSRLLRLTYEDLTYCFWLDKNTVII